jgi:hypothetical protein
LPFFRRGSGDIDRGRRRNIAGGRSLIGLVTGRKPGNKPGIVFLDSSPVHPEKAGNDDKKARPEYHRRGGFSGTAVFFPGPRTGSFSPAGFSYCHIPIIRRNRRIRKDWMKELKKGRKDRRDFPAVFPLFFDQKPGMFYV